MVAWHLMTLDPGLNKIPALGPIRVVIDSAIGDDKLARELYEHLAVLQREGMISVWYPGLIRPGENLVVARVEHVRNAHIVLALLSVDFFSSEDHSRELDSLLERHLAGHVLLIPVIIRPIDTEMDIIKNIKTLPDNGRAVSLWEERSAAWAEVSKTLRKYTRETQQQDSKVNVNRSEMSKRINKSAAENYDTTRRIKLISISTKLFIGCIPVSLLFLVLILLCKKEELIDRLPISIENQANRANDNFLTPPIGRQIYGGIPFEILTGEKAIILTRHRALSSYPTHVDVPVNLNNVSRVHILISGTYIYEKDKTIADIYLKFEKQILSRSLVSMRTIREIWLYDDEFKNFPVQATTAGMTWRNVFAENGQIRPCSSKPGTKYCPCTMTQKECNGSGLLDMISIDVPHEMQSQKLDSIDFQNITTESGLYITALTVETKSHKLTCCTR